MFSLYKLYVRIPVSYEPEEANERLNALDENWILSHIDELSEIIDSLRQLN